MTGRKHPGNPAKMPDWWWSRSRDEAAIREWEAQNEAGMICWACTSPAVATLVELTQIPSYQNGAWTTEMVHLPVCGPGYCLYQDRP